MDFLAVQASLKSLLQHHSSKASILWRSAFFIVQLSHLYMTTGKTIALTRWTFVGKVMSLLFNMLSRFLIAFLQRSKCLLISWLQSPSIVILETKKIKPMEKCLFSSLAHFLIGSFIFLELSCRSCLYIFEINSLLVASFAIIFSHSEGCLEKEE